MPLDLKKLTSTRAVVLLNVHRTTASKGRPYDPQLDSAFYRDEQRVRTVLRQLQQLGLVLMTETLNVFHDTNGVTVYAGSAIKATPAGSLAPSDLEQLTEHAKKSKFYREPL